MPIVDQGKSFVAGYSSKALPAVDAGADGLLVFGDHTCITKFIDFPFLVGADGTKVLRSRRSDVLVRFIAYLLELSPVEQIGYNRHFSKLREKMFRFPDVDEQSAIVDALSDVDGAIAALEHRLESAEAIKTGMMQELLTGRTRFPIEAVS
jgi:type I restriction enzyme S subunit